MTAVHRTSSRRQQHLAPALLAHTETHIRAVGSRAYGRVQFSFIRHGSAIFYSDQGEHLVKAGDVLVLSPNVLCDTRPEGSITTTTVYVDLDYLVDQTFWQHAEILDDRYHAREFLASHFPEPARVLDLGADRIGHISPWLDRLVELSIDSDGTHRFFQMQADLAAVLDRLYPFFVPTPIQGEAGGGTALSAITGRRSLRPIRDEALNMLRWIESDITARRSLADLATEAHLSQSQAHRVFIEAYGMTPLGYQMTLRAREMARLLRSTRRSIQDIGQSVGWNDRSHAARMFRRVVGLNPAQYRHTLIAEN